MKEEYFYAWMLTIAGKKQPASSAEKEEKNEKMVLSVLLLLLILIMHTTVFARPAQEVSPYPEEGAHILAVFAGHNKQPRPTFTAVNDSLDTVWVFFTDGLFRQYVRMDGDIMLYSCGQFDDSTGDFSDVNIIRTQKYMEGAGFLDYRSIHPYRFHGAEYVQLAAEGKETGILSVRWGKEGDPEIWLVCLQDDTCLIYTVSDGEIIQEPTGKNTENLSGEEMICLAEDSALQ